MIPLLAAIGHEIRALTRKESAHKLPPNCIPLFGNALDRSTFADQIQPAETFIQLVGAAHPSPSKGKEFRSIDLVSGRESVAAASAAGIAHFVYVSVAHPAPMMKDYIAVRSAVESLIRASGMNATILRPWYLLGPGHRWPYVLIPAYWIAEKIPATRESARRLGLITLAQMLAALVDVRPHLEEFAFAKHRRFGVSNPTLENKKAEATCFGFFMKEWRRPTLAEPIGLLPSAQQCLTAVFGMGTGRTTAVLSPKNL